MTTTPPLLRPDARDFITDEARELGWTHIELPSTDLYMRDGENVIIAWAADNPKTHCVGVMRFIDGQEEHEVARSPLSLIQARRWLGSEWV